MDDPNRVRRQGEPPMHPSTSTRYMQDPLQARRSVPGGSVDRYNRPAPLNTSPAQGRAMGGAGSYSAYSNYSEQVPGNFNAPMAANTMHYQAGYGQDGRQQQSFGGYNAMPMSYDNIAGASYDPQSQFQRQPAGAPILPTDVPANSYFSNDPGSASTATNIAHAPSGSTPASAYQTSSQVQSYSNNMSSVGAMSQSAPSADVSLEEQEYPAAGGLEDKWLEYQTALRGVFQSIRAGALEGASQSLLDVSSWLLSQVTDLGLNLDDQKLHGDRLKLWQDFNYAWLALFQAQLDLAKSGRPPQRSQTPMTEETIIKMGKELTRLCDGIERHGLIDYDYGVWEEDVIEIAIKCLDVAQGVEGGGSNADAAGASAHGGSN
ncbi:hypothetical protein HYQ44_016651 [Verticillium longisporum]|nr:hypothetical protein HYQ44_016651 [Verticillium longisporum]